MRVSVVGLVALGVALSAGAAMPPRVQSGNRTLASIALSAPFGARPGWRFTASQGPAIPDPLGEANDTAPGAIRLCISKDDGRTCRPSLDRLLAIPTQDDLFAVPHVLTDAKIVQPGRGRPLLLVAVASLHSGDGDQRRATVALAYDRARDTFVTVYEKRTGRNNNQEIRYIADGALRGAIVSAEPTADAPFAFWITVNRIGPDGRYHPVLRYRSATIYNDGNPLPAIDSEMPELEQRLGLRRAGSPIPLPRQPCPKPRVIGRELWCTDRPAKR